jgi:hypothetical protein
MKIGPSNRLNRAICKPMARAAPLLALLSRPPDKIPHGATWLNQTRWEDPMRKNRQ